MAKESFKGLFAGACIAMLASCSSDGVDMRGRSLSISEPKEISPLDASTNLPVFYQLDKITITREKVNNGQQIVERYFESTWHDDPTELARTETIPGRGQYSIRTVKNITDKKRFREAFFAPEDHRVSEIDSGGVGLYADWGGQCRITMGKTLSNKPKTQEGRPNAILYVKNCDALDADVKEIISNFGAMYAADRARIAAKLE